MNSLEEVVKAVLTVSPQPLDAREAAALLESFGCTDDSVRADFGFANIFALGHHIVDCARESLGRVKTSERVHPTGSVLRRELKFASRKFSLSIAFAFPWTLMLVIEYLRPGAVRVPPQWGAVLSLSLIASLIAAGGFGQMIARSGYFYIGMKEADLALRVCLLIAKLGMAASLLAGVLAIALARYLDLFTMRYLAAALVNFVLLSLLWMFCAMISVQGREWRIPAVFGLAILGFSGVKTFVLAGSVFSLFAANFIATLSAGGFAVAGFRKMRAGSSSRTVETPRMAVLLQILGPYFGYGIAYFSFLFADRLAAGSAIPWSSGLSFGINAEYKEGMDIALLVFLILAALVEYFCDRFMRFWYEQAEILPHWGREQMTERLHRRHRRFLRTLTACFLPLLAGIWAVAGRSVMKVPAGTVQTAAFGTLGYFFVSLALFNLIVLFSLNCPGVAFRIVGMGLFANFVPGYLLSHALGVQYAAVGLLLGGLTVFVASHHAVRQTLAHPDYFYSLA